MAFTDPIVAGNELIRAAIQSDNYVPNATGWSVFKNGSAEFDALSLRGSLSVPAVNLGGIDLATVINSRALGCIAWMGGFPTTSTTTQDAIMWTEADIIAGRWYDIALVNITPDITNVKACEFQIRYVTGTSAWPTNASPIMAISLRLSQFEMGSIRTFYKAPTTGRLRLRASIVSLDGANVRCWAPGSGCILAVHDLGVGPNPSGSANNVPPGKTLKEWTFSTALAARYRGNGTLAGGPTPLPSTSLSQGDFADGQGNYRSWMLFDGTARTQIADMVGVPQADILVAEAYFNYWSWEAGAGFCTLGYHNQTGLGSNEPVGGVAGKVVKFFPSTGGLWFDLTTAGFGAGTLMESLNNGYFKGFMVGNYGGTNNYYTGWAEHTPSIRPAIHCKYYK